MKLQTTTGGMINEGSYENTDTFTHSFIKDFKVQSMDLTAGKYPVTYRFEVTPKSIVVRGAYLVVQFPEDV